MNSAKIWLIPLAALIAGCSSKYDECIEKEKQAYRASNPNASYGQVQSRQADFELMCAKFKKK